MTNIFSRLYYLGLGVLVSICLITAYPLSGDEEKFLEREFSSPGAHQLASWLIAQLRRSNYGFQPQELPLLPYRLPIQGKRNSELTNSMMGLPSQMIKNGRK